VESNLQYLCKKYSLENAKHDPDVNCRRCKGQGEFTDRRMETHFCICLFVSPESRAWAAKSLVMFASQRLRD